MGVSSWNPVLHVTRNFFLIKKELNQQVTVCFGSISGTSFIPTWGQTTNWTKPSPFPNNCSAVARTGITRSFFWKCLMENQLLKSPGLWSSLPTGWDMGACLPSQRSRVLRMSNSFTSFFSVSQNSSAALTLQPFLCSMSAALKTVPLSVFVPWDATVCFIAKGLNMHIGKGIES